MKRSLTYRRFFPDPLSLNAGFSRTLLHGVLVAGLLAVIAGIFGMHVMTGSHAVHSSGLTHSSVSTHLRTPGPGAVSTEAAAAVGHSHSGHPHTEVLASHAEEPRAAAGSCGGSCHSMDASAASCTPSAKTGSLTVFPPPAGGLIVNHDCSPGGLAPAYAYRPPGPTPCDLSISRT